MRTVFMCASSFQAYTQLLQQSEQQRKEFDCSLQKSTQQIQSRVNELEQSNKDLLERRYKSESSVRELRSKFQGLEEVLSAEYKSFIYGRCKIILEKCLLFSTYNFTCWSCVTYFIIGKMTFCPLQSLLKRFPFYLRSVQEIKGNLIRSYRHKPGCRPFCCTADHNQATVHAIDSEIISEEAINGCVWLGH